MRIRTIKPEFYASFNIAKLSEPAVILAMGLLNHSCDRGFFEADPRLIKAAIFPLREPSRSIPGMLQECSGIGFIELREASDGRLVGRVVNFDKHQRIEKPSKTISRAQTAFESGTPANQFRNELPEPELPLREYSRNTPVVLPEPSGKKGAGTGNRDQGKGTGNGVLVSADDSAPAPQSFSLGSEAEKKPKQKRQSLTDAEFIASLKANPAYTGLNIDAELGKMQAWCVANKKTPSQRRFVNWLNRAERPMVVQPAGSVAQSIPEPEAWRAWLKDQEQIEWRESAMAREWSEVPRHWQKFIIERMGRRTS